MAEIAWELGVTVAPCTILRWVVRYAEEFAKRWPHFERRVGGSWRADETYVKVRGGWMFLYRAVDERGRTPKTEQGSVSRPNGFGRTLDAIWSNVLAA